jgi:hypothetical protein
MSDVTTLTYMTAYNNGNDFTWCNVTFTSVNGGFIYTGSPTGFTNEVPNYANLTSITIGSQVTYIGDNALSSTVITSINIPNSVTLIGNEAFSDCYNLSLVTIGTSVTTISDKAFMNCSDLTSINIPNSVITIGTQAFYNCIKLISVSIGSSVTTIGQDAFTGINSAAYYIEAYITFLGNIPSIYSYSFYSSFYNPIYAKYYVNTSTNINSGSQTTINSELIYAGFTSSTPIYSTTLTYGIAYSTTNNSFQWSNTIFTSNDGGLNYTGFPTELTGHVPNGENLTSLQIGSSVTTIGPGVFINCNKLTNIQFLGKTIPNIAPDNFNKNQYASFSYPPDALNTEILQSFFVSNSIISDVCFPAGTPVNTDQGIILIEYLNPDIHTIHGEKIIGVTQTITQEKYLVCFNKDALGPNLPSQKTIISKNHCIFYKGKMIPSNGFIGKFDKVSKIKYTGEILYNVLMKNHDKMLINNLICETLHPENSIAKLYEILQKLNPRDQEKLIRESNKVLLKMQLSKKINKNNKQLGSFIFRK